jgi:very-short-patch-repair endonuclease
MEFKDKQKTLFGRLKKLKENATRSELAIKIKLDQLNFKYIFQKGFIQGDNYCIVDFYLPKPHRIALEIDGGYHLTETQIKRDSNRDAYLKKRGFKIIRLTNEIAEKIDNIELEKLLLN